MLVLGTVLVVAVFNGREIDGRYRYNVTDFDTVPPPGTTTRPRSGPTRAANPPIVLHEPRPAAVAVQSDPSLPRWRSTRFRIILNRAVRSWQVGGK
ncbi:hypothetical protein BH18ACT13_BH18ACT13_09930 [soil metagenome]